MRTILAFFLFIGGFTQNESNDISICKIKESYSKYDTCQFLITNKTDKILHYSISIECYMQNGWREIVNSIDNPKSKITIWSKLQANEKREEYFLIEIILSDFLPSLDNFRLKLTYSNMPNENNKYEYSNPFKIK